MKSLPQPSTATYQQYDSGPVLSSQSEGVNAYHVELLEEGKLYDRIHGASHIVIALATR